MKPGQDLSVGGVPFQICLRLIRRPDRTFFSNEIAAMFGLEVSQVSARLGPAYEAGWLDISKHGRANVYSAGPKLVEAMK